MLTLEQLRQWYWTERAKEDQAVADIAVLEESREKRANDRDVATRTLSALVTLGREMYGRDFRSEDPPAAATIDRAVHGPE